MNSIKILYIGVPSTMGNIVLILSILFGNYLGNCQVVSIGAGSYNGGNTEPNFTPKITPKLSGIKIPTNDWWTSLVWGFNSGAFSGELYADPLSCRTVASGLSIRRQTNPTVNVNSYNFDNAYGIVTDFTVGLSGLNAPGTKVDAFSDWNVTSNWDDGSNKMNAIIGHGSPYIYFTKIAGSSVVEIKFTTTPTLVWGSGNAYGVTINGSNYGIFSPTGTSWSGTSTANWTTNLGANNYFSICALPDGDVTAATLNFYKAHAFAFVTNTSISYNYNESTAKLTTNYTATITSQGTENQTTTLLALYRHQWLYSTVNTAYKYTPNARGEMRVTEGNAFSTVMTFNGVLPTLPKFKRASSYQSNLDSYLNAAIAGPPGNDSYNSGKWLGRLAQILQIADPSQQNNSTKFNSFLSSIKTEMQDWLTAGGAKEFRYNSTLGALSPPSNTYGELTQLNDHHFHYGYYIHTAAILARYDQNWVSKPQWGGMVEMLIQDVANWDPVTNPMFPKLRHFDQYAGHSWANGHGDNWAGNDQESSSEAINCWTGIILWGSNTGNIAIRDLGIYLYTTELAAVEQYWFDVSNTVHPSGYTPPYLCRLEGNGGTHTLFFAGGENEKFGINLIPITGGSLYLGRNPSYTNSTLAWMNSNGGNSTNGNWREFFWSMQAMNQQSLNPTYNSTSAIAAFGTGTYTPEVGDSKPRTYHWICNLDTLGQLNLNVTSDIPTYAVFDKGCDRTHVAYNPTPNATRMVSFSDGATVQISPNQLGFVVTNSCNPTANFNTNVISACVDVPVTFTNASTNTNAGTTFFWNFGAGATPATANTAGPHNVSYATSGTKTISLSLDGASSGSKFKTLLLDITPCITSADFTSNSSILCIGEQVVFSNSSSNIKPSTTIFWDFGNGANPATASTFGPHTVVYSTAGTKQIQLSLDGATNGVKYKTALIDVLSTCTFNADFVSDLSTVVIGQNITFTNTSSGLIGNETYSWNFGSGASLPAGTSGAGPHVVNYSTAGLKTITLSVSRHGLNDTETKTFYIAVNTPTSLCAYSEEFSNSTIITNFVSSTQYSKTYLAGPPNVLETVNTNFGNFDFFKYIFNNGSSSVPLNLTSGNAQISLRIKANVNHTMKVMYEDLNGIRTEGSAGANPDGINTINVTTTFQTFTIPYNSTNLVNTNGGGSFNKSSITSLVFLGGSAVTYQIDWVGIGAPCSQAVSAAGPTLTTFTPTSGPTGTNVTINGTGLLNTSQLYINGLAITSFTVNADGTQINFTIPSGATSGKFSVVTPNGQASTIGIFTVLTSLPIFFKEVYISESGNLSWTLSDSFDEGIFSIENSLDGINFQRIGTLDARAKQTIYLFADNQILSKGHYYRITYTDKNGNTILSPIQKIEEYWKSESKIYPNPFTSQLHIEFNETINEISEIKILNYLGVEIYKCQKMCNEDLQIDTNYFTSGVYQLIISNSKAINKYVIVKDGLD